MIYFSRNSLINNTEERDTLKRIAKTFTNNITSTDVKRVKYNIITI